MVQMSVPTHAPVPASTPAPADGLPPPPPLHDEQLLIAALERIELTRSTLEELLSGGLYSQVFV